MGSFISCTLFSNIGLTLGGYLCFILYGESGLYLAGLYTGLFLPYYYFVGFPIMSILSKEKNATMRTAISELITNPVSIVPITSMVVGLILNITGMGRPQLLNEISTRLLIYINTAGYAFGIGIGWNFQKTLKYIKHVLLISSIKFIYNPLVGFILMYLFGYLKLENQIPAKVIFVESFMPSAIMSVVMVKIFKLDDDLSNSAWILTNLIAIPVIPLMISISRVIWST
jgi:predicted permease